MGTDRSGSPRKMLHSLAILLLSAALTQAKFCPRENNGDECRANSTMYKCGVFFKDLTPKLPLTWLGALPDALDKVDEADYKRILGKNINKESFTNSDCKKQTVNSRCYATMSKVATENMDTCDNNLLTTKAEQTMGDYLCGQVKRWGGGTRTSRPTAGPTSTSSSPSRCAGVPGPRWSLTGRLSNPRSPSAAPAEESSTAATARSSTKSAETSKYYCTYPIYIKNTQAANKQHQFDKTKPKL